MRQAIREAELRMLRDCGFLLPEGPEVPSTLVPLLLQALGADGELARHCTVALRAVLRTREAATMPAAAAACAAISLGAEMAGLCLPVGAGSSGEPASSSDGGGASWAGAVHPNTAESAAVLKAAHCSLEEGAAGAGAWEWPEGTLPEEARAQRRQAELADEAELKEEAAFEQSLKSEATDAAGAGAGNAMAPAPAAAARSAAAPPGSLNAKRWG